MFLLYGEAVYMEAYLGELPHDLPLRGTVGILDPRPQMSNHAPVALAHETRLAGPQHLDVRVVELRDSFSLRKAKAGLIESHVVARRGEESADDCRSVASPRVPDCDHRHGLILPDCGRSTQAHTSSVSR